MRAGIGKFTNRRTKTAGKEYDSFYIYVPAEVARDTSFPFKHNDRVKVIISEGRVIIEPES